MNQVGNASVEMSDALVSASPDILFVINNNKIEPISAGENSWLDLKKLSALSLDELFSESLLTSLLRGIEAAREAPDKRVSAAQTLSVALVMTFSRCSSRKPTLVMLSVLASDFKRLPPRWSLSSPLLHSTSCSVSAQAHTCMKRPNRCSR